MEFIIFVLWFLGIVLYPFWAFNFGYWLELFKYDAKIKMELEQLTR